MSIAGIQSSNGNGYENRDILGRVWAGTKNELRDEVSAGIQDKTNAAIDEQNEYSWGAQHQQGGGAPYSYLADETGMIEYKGVMFFCNNEKKELQLGDVSNSKDVIRIPLTEGGCLVVNRDSIGGLGQAIGMFSPEDVKLILRALSLDAKVREMEKETDDMEDGVGKDQKERVDGESKAQEITPDMLREPSFGIGGRKYTNKEWNKLMESVDTYLEEVKSKVIEAEEKREKDRKQNKIIELSNVAKELKTEDAAGKNGESLPEEVLDKLLTSFQ